jgi:hypothetical protein
MSMQTIRVAALSALVGLLGSAVLVAQTPNPPPPHNTTNPSSASSPHQRDTTRSPTPEANPSAADQPADASSPHQRQATASHEQAMKACMDRQAKATPQASKAEMTKACNEQMKAQKEHLSESQHSDNPAPSPR